MNSKRIYIFLIRYVWQTRISKEDLSADSILYVLKAQASRPGVPKRICECVPCQRSFKSPRKYTRIFKEDTVHISYQKRPKSLRKRPAAPKAIYEYIPSQICSKIKGIKLVISQLRFLLGSVLQSEVVLMRGVSYMVIYIYIYMCILHHF